MIRQSVIPFLKLKQFAVYIMSQVTLTLWAKVWVTVDEDPLQVYHWYLEEHTMP